MALVDNIQTAIRRAKTAGRVPTEIFISELTRHHLETEARKHESLFTMRGKPKSVWPSEMERRAITEIFGVKVRIKNSVATDSFILDFAKLVKRIDYKTGKEELVRDVAEPKG